MNTLFSGLPIVPARSTYQASLLLTGLLPALLLSAILALPSTAQDSQTAYLPLQVDNSWSVATILDPPFDPPDTLITATFYVNSEIEKNGMQYFVLSKPFIDTDTVRVGEDGRLYAFANSTERVLFDFAAANNATYQYPFSGDDSTFYNVTVQSNVTIDTFVGTFENCMAFFFDVPTWADEEVAYAFAPDVGLVRLGGAWITGDLIDAQVGDKTYVTNTDSGPIAPDLQTLEVFPNPARSGATVQMSSPMEGGWKLDVVDVQGRLVQRVFGAAATQGPYDIFLHLEDLSSGTYFLRLTGSDGAIMTRGSLVVAGSLQPR